MTTASSERAREAPEPTWLPTVDTIELSAYGRHPRLGDFGIALGNAEPGNHEDRLLRDPADEHDVQIELRG